jgi:hypothetical protein
MYARDGRKTGMLGDEGASRKGGNEGEGGKALRQMVKKGRKVAMGKEGRKEGERKEGREESQIKEVKGRRYARTGKTENGRK